MPVLKVNDQRYSLRPGANRLGAGTDVDVRVDADPTLGIQAIVDVQSDESAIIRPASNSTAVLVNGVALAEPTPLMHGDKLEIAGKKLSYSVERKSGKTQHISASEIAVSSSTRRTPGRSRTATGGRLVSLVDGREYPIPAAGITIGRDASSTIVVAQDEVSRHHAKIAPGRSGYTIRDFSANGVKVNGTRIKSAQVLARSDIIRIGSEELRFYAEIEAPDVKPNVTPAQSSPRIAVHGKRTAESRASGALPVRRGVPGWIWVVLFAADAAAVFYLLKR